MFSFIFFLFWILVEGLVYLQCSGWAWAWEIPFYNKKGDNCLNLIPGLSLLPRDYKVLKQVIVFQAFFSYVILLYWNLHVHWCLNVSVAGMSSLKLGICIKLYHTRSWTDNAGVKALALHTKPTAVWSQVPHVILSALQACCLSTETGIALAGCGPNKSKKCSHLT